MLYLAHYLPRARAPVRPLRGARVEIETLLNRPGYHGDAYVRAFVEDTSQRRVRGDRIPTPRFELDIADCTNTIRLEFGVSTAGDRENSLFKIATLIGALEQFRDGLVAEAELHAKRERIHTGS
jgi:hypothetical protein